LILVSRISTAYVKSKGLQAYLQWQVRPPVLLNEVPGYLHPLEGRFLFWMGRKVPPRGLALEVGSFKGKSAGFLAAGLTSGARLACVDTWRNDAMAYDQPADSWPQFVANTSQYQDRIEAHRGTSPEVAGRWRQSLDLLFIDGDHSYEGCRTDCQSWLSFVRPGGWVLFHDAGSPDVIRAINDCFPACQRFSELFLWSIFAARKRGKS